MTERPPSRIIYLPEIPETEYGQFYLALPRDSRLPASYRAFAIPVRSTCYAMPPIRDA